MSEEQTVVIISPDGDTDYIYFNLSREAAIAEFKQHEDWHNMYESQNIDFSSCVQEGEFDGKFLMLWRNAGATMREHDQALRKKYLGEA